MATILDSFEDDDISEYSGDTGDFSVNTNPGFTPKDGSDVLQRTTDGGEVWIISTSGLSNYFAKGETARVWVRTDSTGNFGFVWGAQDTSNFYYVEVDAGANDLQIKEKDGGSKNNLSTAESGSWSISANTWYELKITWDDGTLGGVDNDMTVELLDDGGSVLETVSANDSRLANQTGIGFFSNANFSDKNHYWDYARKPDAAPAAPTNLTASQNATNPESASDLAWTDNATSEDNFEVQFSTDGGSSWTTATSTLPADTTSYTHTGEDEGTTYTFRVRATSTSGNSDWSNTDTNTTTLPAPSSLTASAGSDPQNENDLSWTDNATDEVNYAVEFSTDGGSSWSTATSSLAPDTTSYTHSGLDPGTTYTYRVRALGEDANSSYSNTDSQTTAVASIATSLPDVGQPTLSAAGQGEMQVDWTDVINYGDYRVQIREAGESTWSGSAAGFAETTVGESTTTHTFTGLSDGQEYEVRLRTETEHATGTYTTSVSAFTVFPQVQNFNISKAHALDFVQANDDFVTVGGFGPDSDPTDAVTVAIRVTPDDQDTVWVNRRASNDGSVSIGFKSWTVRYEAAQERFRWQVSTWDGSGSGGVRDTAGTVGSAPPGREHVVVGTYKESTGQLTLYTNGDQEDQGTAPAGERQIYYGHDDPASSDDNRLFFGDFDGVNAPGAGRLGEVVVNNGEWVQADVDEYQGGSIPSGIGFWPFDEGSGSTALDAIGNNDGTITGADWVEHDTETSLSISWDDAWNNEDEIRLTRYRVYDYGLGPPESLGPYEPGRTVVTDMNLSPGNTYRYELDVSVGDILASDAGEGTTTSAGTPRDIDVIPTGWYVEVEHPNGRTLKPTVLDGAQYEPRLLNTGNGLPTCRIPVPKDEAWLDSSWEGQPMTVYEDGVERCIDELDAVEMEPGRTVLVGIGGVELETRVQTSIDSKESHQAADDLVSNNTSYGTNVDDPGANTQQNQKVASLSSEANFNDNLLTTLAATDPVKVVNPGGTDGELHLLQSSHFGTNDDFVSNVNQTDVYPSTTENYENFDIHLLESAGDYVSFSFTTAEYQLDAANVELHVRIQEPDSNIGFSVYFDGTLITDGVQTGSGGAMKWIGHITGAEGSYPTLSPGSTHTVRIEPNEASTGFGVDAIVVQDGRYSYTFDNQIDTDSGSGKFGRLDGPEDYPSGSTVVETVDFSPGLTVAGGRMEVTVNNVSNLTIGVSNDNGATYLTADDSDEVGGTFGSTDAQIRGKFELGRFGDARQDSPATGFNGHVIDLATLYADLEDTPLALDLYEDDSLVSVLQQIANDAGQIGEVRRLADGTTQVEWTTPGQRTDDRSPAVLDFTVDKQNLRPYERVVVKGAGRPRSGEAFTSNYDTAVSLAKSPIVKGSESVYDPSSNTIFDEGTDYTMDYKDGEITVQSGGSMSDSTSYEIDYRWQTEGNYTVESAGSNPRTKVVNLSTAITTSECQQLARVIARRIQAPLYAVRLVLDSAELHGSLVDDVAFDGVPTNGTSVVIKDQKSEQGTVVLSGRNREDVGSVIDDIRTRVGSLAKRA